MRVGQEISRTCLGLLAFTFALCWSHAAYADVLLGTILGIFSWLVLLPLGLLQMIVAGAMRQHLKRSQVGATGLLAIVGIVAALVIPRVFDLYPRGIGMVVAGIGFVPGLPVVVDLLRQRAWSASVLSFVILPAPLALIILESVGRR